MKERMKSEESTFYIAFDDRTPCGICSTCASRDDDLPGYGEVVAIYALQNYWSKGVGKLLMDTAIAGLKERGYNRVILWTFEANTRARRFYEKYGYIFDGTKKNCGFADADIVRYKMEL